jgi:hypothetical protein
MSGNRKINKPWTLFSAAAGDMGEQHFADWLREHIQER